MPELTMKDIFNQCQKGLQHHNKMLKVMRTMYSMMEFDSFWKEFLHLMKFSMVVYKREAAVERTIEFICKFVSAPDIPKPSSQGNNETVVDEDDIEDNPLLIKTFEFLLDYHSACDRGVRFRCCQMINKLLNNLSQDAQIDDELYDRIYSCMLERMRDKIHVVRKHSVLAISRLQDPTDDNCPVIKAYLYLMSCDPNPDVRRAVLGVIAPSTRTLAHILERTRDVNESVRQVAYCVLAEKIHIKSLTIAQRLQLLHEGLNDRAASVRDICSKKVLQAWLRSFSGNILDLLKSLDVNSTEICEQVLNTMFQQSQVADLVSNFNLLDDSYMVVIEELDCESSMYWRMLLKYIQSKGNEYEEILETIIPNCLLYANYLRKYLEDNMDCDDIEKQLEIEFVLQQLLILIDSMDLADQAGRKALEKILHDMLVCETIGSGLVKHILPRLETITTTSESLVNYLAETISEIKEPITIVEKGINKDQQRQIDLKIASIRVKLNQLREEMDDCVQKQEFVKAAELKGVIGELDVEKLQLLDSARPEQEEVRTEKNDPATLLKCLTIISEMLKILPLKTLSSTVQMMLEAQIIPGIQSEYESVRNEAVAALGLCCHLKQDLVLIYLPLFMQVSQVDTVEVRTSALTCLFDLVHMYGIDILKDTETTITTTKDTTVSIDTTIEAFDTTQQNESTNDLTVEPEPQQQSEAINVAAKLVAILSAFLDSESVELRTVAAEGLAKLMLSGRLVSSKILSHLILLWCNPVTEDDHHLRQCLGAFFPIFSFAARVNQEIMEESFMQTLNTLMNAPTSSPLSDVDICKVSDILVQLINTKRLVVHVNTDSSKLDNPGHDNICIKICNEILTNSDSFNLKFWIRILNQLDISQDNEQNIKTVIGLCEEMLEVSLFLNLILC
ncbi:hypothetical protein LOTGIDRAFT_117517 [Lottia gigantea]|uniref:Nuclear condensin complex subunit 3 C-terminal domain-containing protein n=1 Tax=Lottia gigantea TaxID=225164 RepID=V3ZUE7_LOTGI|nr:hypothetical protein LOTGIDRAFT_117517 [Lottia gigantea]ESO95108.1 hypothetical protein LOTGIDRAFT_117517 [Lottia gigantea]